VTNSLTSELPLGICPLTSFNCVSEQDLRKLITASNAKSCHLDPMPTRLVLDSLDVLLPTLTRIVNMSLANCVMPSSLKTATVSPLIKKSNLECDELKNYRPVSNLPYLSKLIEKVVVKQLDDHMLDNSLYRSDQSAYRRFHSTETALVKIMDSLLCAMDNKKCNLLVLLDQSAAFDTVNQDLMLQRLESSYGITSDALQWLSSYLKGRTQAVSIGSCSSEPKDLATGFPQGSVLGPFMYPIYTSPLFDIASKYDIMIHMYADDTQLYVSFSADEDNSAVSKLQDCILEIRQWMMNNHLKLNDTKTEFLVIGTPQLKKRLSSVSSLHIGDSNVEAVDSARNIGAIIDNTLSMAQHVSSVCRTCYMHLHNISKIRSHLTEDAAATIVNALVTSCLDYANAILYGIPQYMLKRLQQVQYNAARLVLRKKKRDHGTPLLKQLHWLPIQTRIEYKLNLLTFKSLNNLAPVYLTELLCTYNPSRTLRSSSMGLLQEKNAKTKKAGERAYSIAAPKLWNRLPQELRSLNELVSFKTALKTYYFKKVFE